MTDEDKKSLKGRYNSITSGFTMVNTSLSMYRDFKAKYQERFMYTASLDESSFVYHDVMQYIDNSTKSRNYKFHSTRDGVWRYYDSDATAVFYVGGWKIKASLKKPTVVGGGGLDDSDTFSSAMPAQRNALNQKDVLWFTCHHAEGILALENLLKEMTAKKTAKKKVNYLATPDRWGDWDYNELPTKALDTIFLPHGVMEDLEADIQNFLDSKEKFSLVGIPYHRGYALYGKPGNGKSSLALGLANRFTMDLYNLPLSTVHDDKSLHNAISGVRPESILLLEDIDIFSETMDRESKNQNAPTLAGLLNTLDGVATPHGLITVMTTNHINKLDPALTRPGRMDYKLELKAPVHSQIADMFARVFNEPLGMSETKEFASMAAAADVFKRNIDDPEAVRMEFKDNE